MNIIDTIIKHFENIKRKEEERQEELELLRQIAKSLKVIDQSIEFKLGHGSAIRTTTASRY